MSSALCPRCGSESVAILYGLPTYAAFEAADRGEVRLAGCDISDADPEFACVGIDCGLEFGLVQR